MKRDYDSGEANDVTFFIGTEIEKTPAYNLKTLFVVGIQDLDTIKEIYNSKSCQHIYLGANQSFDLTEDGAGVKWNTFVHNLLEWGVLTTIDFDVKYAEWVCENGFGEYNNAICQVSVKVPYATQLGYNATIKIDDTDFKASNPGVWCHQLHDLMDRDKYTDWTQYSQDEIIE